MAKRVLSKSRPKRDQICERLQEMILRGERRPGSRLGQEELAEYFGVGQGTVREALLELRRHGLVESIDRRGVFVSRIDKKALIEAFEVREMEEALAVRRCCVRATRLEIAELMETAERIHRLGRESNTREMASLDREFHTRLIQMSANSMLIRLTSDCRLLSRAIGIGRDIAIVRDEHIGILTAIQDGRTDDAERLVRAHITAERMGIE